MSEQTPEPKYREVFRSEVMGPLHDLMKAEPDDREISVRENSIKVTGNRGKSPASFRISVETEDRDVISMRILDISTGKKWIVRRNDSSSPFVCRAIIKRQKAVILGDSSDEGMTSTSRHFSFHEASEQQRFKELASFVARYVMPDATQPLPKAA